MKKLLLCGLMILLAVAVYAQDADSLLIANFEDDELHGWSGWGDATEQLLISGAPDDDDNLVMEAIIDCGRDGEKKGGYAISLNIVVKDDTASSVVVYAWIDQQMLAELQGFQFFCMDMSQWQWQAKWYTPNSVTAGAWNRMSYHFSQSFDNIANFGEALGSGVQCGVEFVFNEGSEFYGSVFGDNSSLFGVGGGDTKVAEKIGYTLPSTFSLEQNYPNPFNPQTTIVYNLPNREYVTINIFDVNGRLVRTLVNNEAQPAGQIAVPFDASALSSGIYYYNVIAGQQALTGKMLLVK